MGSGQQRLSGKISLEELEGDAPYLNLGIPLAEADLRESILNLSLLAYGLVDSVCFDDRQVTVRFVLSESGVLKRRPTEFTVGLTQVQVEYVLSFLLVYFRDGAADVDHVDLETTSEGMEAADVTISVESAKQPMSADEARRILDLGS